MINLHSLRLFVTLAEQLHFRKTSERHHVTVSTLTRTLQQLEKEAGVVLFDRNNRHVALTDYGIRFLQFAKHTLDSYEHLQVALHPHHLEHIKGDIKLYSTVTAAYSILPPLIKGFRERYPLIMTYLETGAANNSSARLKKGEVDFSIGIISSPLDAEVLCCKVLETPLVFVVPQGQECQNPQEFPLIFPEQGDLATRIRVYLNRHHWHNPIHSYVEGHEAILAMVSAGLGAAILPEIVIEHSHLQATVAKVLLEHPLPVLNIGVFVKAASLVSPVKRIFWDYLQREGISRV